MTYDPLFACYYSTAVLRPRTMKHENISCLSHKGYLHVLVMNIFPPNPVSGTVQYDMYSRAHCLVRLVGILYLERAPLDRHVTESRREGGEVEGKKRKRRRERGKERGRRGRRNIQDMCMFVCLLLHYGSSQTTHNETYMQLFVS